MALMFELLDETQRVAIQIKTTESLLSCGTVYHAAQGGSNYKGKALGKRLVLLAKGQPSIPRSVALGTSLRKLGLNNHTQSMHISLFSYKFDINLICNIYSFRQ